MTYSAHDLERRFNLSQELLSTHVPPRLTASLVDLRLSGPGRQLNLPFPSGLAPKPGSGPVGDPAKALPHVDVVVLTYTSDEGKALADVMTPGKFSSDWNHYTRKMADYLPNIRNGAPSRQAGRLASYWTAKVGRKSVLVMKSELHMHQDVKTVRKHPSLPIRDLFTQIIKEAQPSHFFCIGTAGGVYTDKPLGTVALSRSAQFRCEKDFKNEPYAHAQYKSDWTVPDKYNAEALQLMGPLMSHLDVSAAANLAQCPCRSLERSGPPAPQFIRDGSGGIPPFHPILTTDYFEYGTDQNNLGQAGMAVEMDDAVFGLACSTLKSPPLWASIRNYSDPAINGGLSMPEQEQCASHIYLRYGYWTSVAGAIATWSVIAGL